MTQNAVPPNVASTTEGSGNTASEREWIENAVVILANDHVHDWLKACLNSLRNVSPEIPCWILPFDDRLERTSRLAASMGATIVHPPMLAELTRLGADFCPQSTVAQHVFRKLAALLLPARRILFSDADIIFLRPVEPLFGALHTQAKEILYADSDIKRVYSDPDFARRMQQEHAARGINTGFWLTRGGQFSLDTIQAAAERATPYRQFFDPLTMEQPFLNFLLDTSGLRSVHFSERISGFPLCSWGVLPVVWTDGVPHCRDHHQGFQYNPEPTPLHMLHWAGVPLGWSMPNRELFLTHGLSGESPWRRRSTAMRWWLRHQSSLWGGRLRRSPQKLRRHPGPGGMA
jgi:hypothetical protein